MLLRKIAAQIHTHLDGSTSTTASSMSDRHRHGGMATPSIEDILFLVMSLFSLSTTLTIHVKSTIGLGTPTPTYSAGRAFFGMWVFFMPFPLLLYMFYVTQKLPIVDNIINGLKNAWYPKKLPSSLDNEGDIKKKFAWAIVSSLFVSLNGFLFYGTLLCGIASRNDRPSGIAQKHNIWVGGILMVGWIINLVKARCTSYEERDSLAEQIRIASENTSENTENTTTYASDVFSKIGLGVLPWVLPSFNAVYNRLPPRITKGIMNILLTLVIGTFFGPIVWFIQIIGMGVASASASSRAEMDAKASEMGAKASEMGAKARQKASEMGAKASEMGAKARQKASEMGAKVRQKASEMGARASAGGENTIPKQFDQLEKLLVSPLQEEEGGVKQKLPQIMCVCSVLWVLCGMCYMKIIMGPCGIVSKSKSDTFISLYFVFGTLATLSAVALMMMDDDTNKKNDYAQKPPILKDLNTLRDNMRHAVV
jgi:F0F1-type ATP synthase membrane subunit b/b'